MRGDWRKAYDYLAGLTSWNLIPAKEDVLAMLKAKLQQEGLRTYLLTYGAFYHSLSQDQLSDMFDLSEKEVCMLSSLNFSRVQVPGVQRDSAVCWADYGAFRVCGDCSITQTGKSEG